MISIFGAILLALLLTTNCVPAEFMETEPCNNLDRDIHAVDTITNFGLTIKCLVDLVGDADIISEIYKTLDNSIVRAQNLSSDFITSHRYMDIVNQETSLTLTDISSIHPLCSNIASYCHHRSNSKESSTVPKEVRHLHPYLSMTGPLVKCLRRGCKEEVAERVYKIFQNAVVNIREDTEVKLTSVGAVLLQSKAIVLELLKLDDNCNDEALTYDHCAQMR